MKTLTARRIAYAFLLLMISGVASMCAAQREQQKPSADALEVQKVRDNVYLIKGGGGNSTVFITSTGVVLVDAKSPGWGTPLLEKIKTITDKPVKVLINTHSHPDHTSGNVEMPPGVEIITTEYTKENMQQLDLYKKPENAKGLPSKTFKDKMTLFSGADEVDLYWFGPGETSGDTYVFFPAVHVAVAEDQFSQKGLHIINPVNGGSPVKYPDSLVTAFAAIKRAGIETIISGHDGLLTVADFEEWVRFQKDFLAWVEAGRKAGKTVDELTAEYKTPDGYQGYEEPDRRRVKAHIQGIYDELGPQQR
jgi:cyclase